MPDPIALSSAIREPGLLSEIYKDLAQPGVKQVGRALETVLQLGGSMFMPLRLMNETARRFEQRKFEEIANRFAHIPEENIIDSSPEIGVPIMEKLSITQDCILRSMFVELLAKSSDSSLVSQAHPSFVNIISSICPDEAVLLKSMGLERYHPFVSVDLRDSAGAGKVTPHEIVMLPPDGLSHPHNMPLYISNLIGLGILEARRNTSLTADGAYDKVVEYAKNTFGYTKKIDLGDGNGERTVDYGKHIIVLLPYGTSFIKACV